MKDQVFTGRDVERAVQAASQTLGIPAGQLRYVVIEPGRAESLGVRGTEARIAVLLGSAPETRVAPATAQAPGVAKVAWSSADLPPALKSIVREFARAADLELSPEVVPEDGGGLLVRISGADASGLTKDEAAALVHVLQKVGSRGDLRVPVAVEIAGSRTGRDDELKARAVTLASEVRASGQPRETPALNGYERRVVHVTLADQADVETYSVGQGDARRVRIVLRAAGSATEVM